MATKMHITVRATITSSTDTPRRRGPEGGEGRRARGEQCVAPDAVDRDSPLITLHSSLFYFTAPAMSNMGM